jgi:hypothetical protein
MASPYAGGGGGGGSRYSTARSSGSRYSGAGGAVGAKPKGRDAIGFLDNLWDDVRAIPAGVASLGDAFWDEVKDPTSLVDAAQGDDLTDAELYRKAIKPMAEGLSYTWSPALTRGDFGETLGRAKSSTRPRPCALATPVRHP